MTRRAIAAVLAWPVTASGQAGFFDDFNGSALQPHWQWLHPTSYSVGGGVLEVTALPFHLAGTPLNIGVLRAEFPALTGDFEVRAVMGWDPGAAVREMSCNVYSTATGWYAYVGYKGPNSVLAGCSNPPGPVTGAAPASGLHEFILRRRGASASFIFDGTPIEHFPAGPAQTISRVELPFLAITSTGAISPLRVESIEVRRYCYADCDEGGTLTVADFGCYQTKFVAADPYADCDASNSLTVADFSCFQTAFVTGCP